MRSDFFSLLLKIQILPLCIPLGHPDYPYFFLCSSLESSSLERSEGGIGTCSSFSTILHCLAMPNCFNSGDAVSAVKPCKRPLSLLHHLWPHLQSPVVVSSFGKWLELAVLFLCQPLEQCWCGCLGQTSELAGRWRRAGGGVLCHGLRQSRTPKGHSVVSDSEKNQGNYRCGYRCCSRLNYSKGTSFKWWHWRKCVECLRELKL